MSQRLQHARLRYRLLLWLLIPPLLLMLLWQALRYRDAHFLLQRLGFGFRQRNDKPLYIHCASVGEIHAILPLVEALRATQPQQALLLSTTTPTGGRILSEKQHLGFTWCYLPIDWPAAVRRFIRRQQPIVSLIVETEIWPNLFRQLAHAQIPILMINARLSPRSMNAPSWILDLYRDSLGLVGKLMARSQEDLARYRTLGAAVDKSECSGNIKFHARAVDPAQLKTICPRPYVLAASTHADEELLISRAWLQQVRGAELVLVIAPRHPKRRNAILKSLQTLGAKIAVRSRGDRIEADTQIYLADTLGEMPSLIAAARFVIMGGSFIPRGGHNILEPAAMAKACITGPHMHSFSEETRLLTQAKGLIQCDANALAERIDQLLSDPALAEQMGQNAKNVISAQTQILNTYLKGVEVVLSNRQASK